MRQSLALIAVEKHNVARFGLLFAQFQAQAHPFDLAFRLTSLQRVPGPPQAELFFRKTLDSCERLMRTPGDFPAMPYTLRISTGSEPQKTYPLVSQTEFA